MTTDTIPEAKTAAELIVNWHNRAGDHEELDLLPIIHAALIDYHKRRLAECGGDARELADKLWNILDPIDNAEVGDLDKATELLQLHTAKAVEEAIQKLTPEQVHNICHNLEKTVSPEEFAKGCEDYQKKLFGFCPTTDTITTLQKQCEELCHDRDNWKIAAECEHDDKDSMRTRAEKAEAALAMTTPAFQDLMNRCNRATLQAEKAEAEVAELSKQFGTCSICGKVAWRTDKNDATLEHCQFCELNNQLTQLQQDVRPLVALLSDTKSIANTTGFLVVGAHIKEALETFLTKHPECKQEV